MRLLTRSDFDGLICAVLLKHIDLIDEYFFVHPKDMQDGKYEVTINDVLANVPYVSGWVYGSIIIRASRNAWAQILISPGATRMRPAVHA